MKARREGGVEGESERGGGCLGEKGKKMKMEKRGEMGKKLLGVGLCVAMGEGEAQREGEEGGRIKMMRRENKKKREKGYGK